MEAYLFIYSRLERFDYRLIYAPSKSFLPDPIRSEFIAFAREVINTDNVSNGNISAPRWSIICRENKILYGIGIYNKELGDCYSELENRDIRGYFGIVFNYENGNLPMECFSLVFFQDLFSSYFAPFWHAEKKDENKINSIVQKIDLAIEQTSTVPTIVLNTSSSFCKIIPEPIVVQEVINSAIGLNDIELVLGLNDIKHVTTANLSRFRNISIIGNSIEKSVPITKVKSKLEYSKKENSTVLISEQNGDRVPSSVSNEQFQNKATRKEESNCEYLADSIYKKLRKCGINVKAIVHYLAKKCGLQIIESSHYNYNEPSPDNYEDNSVSYNNDADMHDEKSEETIRTAKTIRRNRLSEIRKELSMSEQASEPTASEISNTPLNIDFNNLEELDKHSSKEKDNLSIEDI